MSRDLRCLVFEVQHEIAVTLEGILHEYIEDTTDPDLGRAETVEPVIFALFEFLALVITWRNKYLTLNGLETEEEDPEP